MIESAATEVQPRAKRLQLSPSHISVAAVLPLDGYVRLPTVLKVFPVSKSTWWSGIAAGRFPRGIKLSPRVTVWRASDIRELIARSDPTKAKAEEAA